MRMESFLEAFKGRIAVVCSLRLLLIVLLIQRIAVGLFLLGAAFANEGLPSERRGTITSHCPAHTCRIGVQPTSQYAARKLGLELVEGDVTFCLRSWLLQGNHAFAKPQGCQREG